MASIQSKRGKSGKKTYYVVVAHAGRRKWIKAGTLAEAKKLKKLLEELSNSERQEKLGLLSQERRIDEFFQDYLDNVRLSASANTVKRYKAVLNTFLCFLRLYHPKILSLGQITPEVVEDYQKQRLESVELKKMADGEKNGNHVNKRLPLPQTVNYEVGVLRSVLIRAHERGLVSEVSTTKVKKLRTGPKRKIRILDENECKVFLRAAREIAKNEPGFGVFHLAFRFLLNTGLRSAELCNLTWDDVDLESGLIKIQEKDGWSLMSRVV